VQLFVFVRGGFPLLKLRLAAAFCFVLAIVFFRSVALEVLNGAFVSLGLFFRGERTQIAPFTCLWILLSRVQSILAGLQFANHASFDASLLIYVVLLRWFRPPSEIQAAISSAAAIPF
jgi:hypothetical protein